MCNSQVRDVPPPQQANVDSLAVAERLVEVTLTPIIPYITLYIYIYIYIAVSISFSIFFSI